MSSLLWKHYLLDDIQSFEHLLETATYQVRGSGARGGASQNVYTPTGTSPGHHGGASPLLGPRARKVSGGLAAGHTNSGGGPIHLTRADINWRDANGLTILHHAASMVTENAVAFAQALIDHPLVDLYLQDLESGWTALHRAFYFGNITVARAILERDAHNAFGQVVGGRTHSVLGLIKIKDREGLGPLDLYAATIQDRSLHPTPAGRGRADSSGSEQDLAGPEAEEPNRASHVKSHDACGDECYTFGSNRNVTLGFGDTDDRQWPERISLKRPDHLLQRFYSEHMENIAHSGPMTDSTFLEGSTTAHDAPVPLESMPWVVQNRPILISDVQMSKLHTAVLTDDPESNLYICGHGPGGRLGLGHEKTSFTFACVEGGALAGIRVAAISLGQNHTLAISDEGEMFSWGSNAFGQLGYTLPRNGLSEEDSIQTLPRQIFGPLKRETVQGIAASRTHSVAFTGSSLYTWGKNDGQLGLVDSDARSLEVLITPRKVAASLFSTAIKAVTATEKATVCLLSGSNDCWVFANYGYAKIAFPLANFGNHRFNVGVQAEQLSVRDNRIIKITSGGDSICAMTSNGEVYSVTVSQPNSSAASSVSTTNPAKIRASLAKPLRIWMLRKNNMAARDVGVDVDGSIIIATHEGSVWKRSRRAKIKDALASGGTAEYKPKDFKFSRISGLTRVIAVRASAHGAYAAVRRDCDVTRTQIDVAPPQLWSHLLALLPFAGFRSVAFSRSGAWQGEGTGKVVQLRRQLLESEDLEQELSDFLRGTIQDASSDHDVLLKSSLSDLVIPAHTPVLTARSRILRDLLASPSDDRLAMVNDVMHVDTSGRVPVITFIGIDPLTLMNLALYCYADDIVDYWHWASRVPKMAHRYRTVRTELMKLSVQLGLKKLEAPVRQMINTPKSMAEDFEMAFRDPTYFDNADILVELADDEIAVHSSIVCQRCPFFEGMFKGRAGGAWLDNRRGHASGEGLVRVDLKDVEAATFKLVLRHIYADTGEELFDMIFSSDLEEFFEVVMDVLSVANELMLNRLVQICQRVMGRYVNIRNVCPLLNAVAPSAVSEFKDAALEYMCLNLEAMLHGGLLDELEEDLLLELDERVRSNQKECMPFFRSGRAEALLLERHSELAEIMDRNRQAKIDAITLRAKHADVDNWASSSFRGFSLEGDDGPSSTQQKSRRRSRGSLQSARSPALKGKEAVERLGTTYDEQVELDLDLGSPALVSTRPEQSVPRNLSIGSPRTDVWYDSKGKALTPSASLFASSPLPREASSPSLLPVRSPATPNSAGGAPWGSSPAASSKLDLRDIMQQTTSQRVSNLSAGLDAARTKAESGANANASARTSQKERKRLQQQALQHQSSSRTQSSLPTLDTQSTSWGTPPSKGSPWQTVGSTGKVTSLQDVMQTESLPAATKPATNRAPSTPQLTMRQTIANGKMPDPSPKDSAHKPGKHSGSRPSPITSTSSPAAVAAMSSTPPTPSTPSATGTATGTAAPTRSVRHHHQPRPPSPTLQLSMADILSQQQLEKDIIAQVREDNAKRSLQDIQAEQEFQEWWDKEEQRQRAESGLVVPSSSAGRTGGHRTSGAGADADGRGKSGGRSRRGGGGRKRGDLAAESEGGSGGARRSSRQDGGKGEGAAAGDGLQSLPTVDAPATSAVASKPRDIGSRRGSSRGGHAAASAQHSSLGRRSGPAER